MLRNKAYSTPNHDTSAAIAIRLEILFLVKLLVSAFPYTQSSICKLDFKSRLVSKQYLNFIVSVSSDEQCLPKRCGIVGNVELMVLQWEVFELEYLLNAAFSEHFDHITFLQ